MNKLEFYTHSNRECDRAGQGQAGPCRTKQGHAGPCRAMRGHAGPGSARQGQAGPCREGPLVASLPVSKALVEVDTTALERILSVAMHRWESRASVWSRTDQGFVLKQLNPDKGPNQNKAEASIRRIGEQKNVGWLVNWIGNRRGETEGRSRGKWS